MKLTLEQFETQWANSKLSVTDWFDTTYELFKELEALQSRSCEGCKNLVETGKSFKHCDELAINISHMDWGSFCCSRYEPKDNQ